LENLGGSFSLHGDSSLEQAETLFRSRDQKEIPHDCEKSGKEEERKGRWEDRRSFDSRDILSP
jgi:hypothetical protein